MGGSLPRWCAPFLLAFALGSARADETPPASLVYNVGQGVQRCPTQAEFLGLLTREVGEDPFAANPGLRLEVTLTARPNGVSGVVEITAKGALLGRRELSSGDCSALAAALALVVGVELDPFALARRAQNSQSTATVAATAIEAPLPVEPPRHRTQWMMGVGALLAGGLAPSVVPGVTFGASLRKPDWPGRWEFGLEFQGLPPVTAPLGGIGSGSVSHVLLTPLVCAHPWWIFGVCALFPGGVTIAEGQGFGTPQTTTTGYAAAGLRVTVEVPLDPELRLVFHADGAYQITREPLQYVPPMDKPCTDGSAPVNGVCNLWSPTPFTWNIGFALQGRIL